MTVELSREDEQVLKKGWCSREEFIAMRERELSEKGVALAEFRKDADGLTAGDREILKRMPGISKKQFLEARAKEKR